jgi:hypothetical protein
VVWYRYGKLVESEWCWWWNSGLVGDGIRYVQYLLHLPTLGSD